MSKYLKVLMFVLPALIMSGCGSKKGDGSEFAHNSDRYGHSYAEPGSQADLAANIGDRILFPYDSSAITSEASQVLAQQAAWCKQHGATFIVEGHCDERGTDEYNLALGARRAESVRTHLVKLGLEPHQVRTISYGKQRPDVEGHDSNAWNQNRRGVTLVASHR